MVASSSYLVIVLSELKRELIYFKNIDTNHSCHIKYEFILDTKIQILVNFLIECKLIVNALISIGKSQHLTDHFHYLLIKIDM